MKVKKKTVRVNIWLVLFVCVCFIRIIIQLCYVNISTIVDGMDIEAFANNRNTTKKMLYATRGSIYDTNGDYLAQTVNCYTLIAYLAESRTKDINRPQHVVDKELTAKLLSQVFINNGIESMTYEYVLSRLNDVGKYQVEFGMDAKEISEGLKNQIIELGLPGLDFIPSTKRYYPMGDFASYLIGYAVKDDNGKINGNLSNMGIEAAYNKELAGVDGYTEYQTDTYGYKLPNSTENRLDSVSGSNIYLTIDNNIQLFIEQEINSLVKLGDMDMLTWSVADAKSGAILASASYPSFNPNKLKITDFLNPLVSKSYEPGSTMKIFSFMAAMENGKYDGSKKYESGTIKVNDATIKDFNSVGWGSITFDSGFAYSSNVAATNLALSIGVDGLVDFYNKAGFGEETDIELPGEVSGIVNVNNRVELATASFGQGITTTPIQNIQALTMLANDGVMLKPYIIDKITNPDTGKVEYTGGRKEIRQVVSEDTSSKMRELMHDVVYSGKTDAKNFKPQTIQIIGKTGTAQIAGNGGYLTGTYDYIRSFATLFPYEDPQYILYISVKQFKGDFKKVAKAVANVIDEIAKYKNLVDTTTTSNANQIIKLNNYLNNDISYVSSDLENKGLKSIVLGDGKFVTMQYPYGDDNVLVGSKVFLKTNSSNFIMPNVIGWSRNEIITYCNLLGINYNITGNGRVISTSIDDGNIIDLSNILNINLG